MKFKTLIASLFICSSVLTGCSTEPEFSVEPLISKPIDVVSYFEPTINFTKFVTDFYTRCETSEQFGIAYKHELVFDTYNVVMTECYSKYDNIKNAGHIVVMQPSYTFDSWYGDDYKYITVSDTVSGESSSWINYDYATCDGNVSEFVNQQYKTTSNLQTMYKLLEHVFKSRDYKIESRENVTYVTYVSNGAGLKDFKSILGDMASTSTVKIKLRFNESQIDMALETLYDRNDLGVHGDVYKYSIEFTNDYYLSVPADVVIKASESEGSLESMYNLLMN